MVGLIPHHIVKDFEKKNEVVENPNPDGVMSETQSVYAGSSPREHVNNLEPQRWESATYQDTAAVEEPSLVQEKPLLC